MTSDTSGAVDDWLECRRFSCGPIGVRIRTTEADVKERLDRLFSAHVDADLPIGDDGFVTQAAGGVPVVDLRISAEELVGSDGSERWLESWDPTRLRVRSRRLWRHEESLCHRLIRNSLAHDLDALHLHAGVVARNGVGVMIVGPRGCGKSTLVATLVRQGWTYLSDETARLSLEQPDGFYRVSGYPFPLLIRRSAWAYFSGVPTIDDAAGSAPHRKGARVPAIDLGSEAVAAVGSPHELPEVALYLIVYPSHGSVGASYSIDAVESVERLVAEALDLERAGASAMDIVAGLVAQVPAVAYDVDDLDHASAMIESFLADANLARTHTDVAVLPGPFRSQPAPEGYHLESEPEKVLKPDAFVSRAPDVSRYLIGDEGFIYGHWSGTIVRLDATGLAIWERLDSPVAAGDLSRSIASEVGIDSEEVFEGLAPFLNALLARRLLELPNDGVRQ